MAGSAQVIAGAARRRGAQTVARAGRPTPQVRVIAPLAHDLANALAELAARPSYVDAADLTKRAGELAVVAREVAASASSARPPMPFTDDGPRGAFTDPPRRSLAELVGAVGGAVAGGHDQSPGEPRRRRRSPPPSVPRRRPVPRRWYDRHAEPWEYENVWRCRPGPARG